MRIASLLLAGLLSAPTVACAQRIQLDGSQLRPATDTSYTLVVSPSRVDTIGWATQTLTRIRAPSGDAWVQVYRWHDRDGTDSADSLVMSMDLSPITETRNTPLGSVAVTYTGPRVQAAVQPASGSRRTVDTTFASTVYASAAVDAMARALAPSGTSPLVDFYYPFPAPLGLRQGQFQAGGSATIRGRGGIAVPCWVVIAHTVGGATTFWVSKATGEVVQFDDHEGGTIFRFRRPGAPAA